MRYFIKYSNTSTTKIETDSNEYADILMSIGWEEVSKDIYDATNAYYNTQQKDDIYTDMAVAIREGVDSI